MSTERNCLFKGCVLIFVLALGLIVSAVVAGVIIVRNAQSYLADHAVLAPLPAISDQEYAELRAKVTPFAEAYEKGEAGQLTLTADEINALIAREPHLSRWRDHLRFDLRNDHLVTQASWPLPVTIGSTKMGKLYFNCTSEASVTADDGKLRWAPVRLEFNGKRAPSLVRQLLSHEDVRRDLTNNLDDEPQAGPFVRRLKTLRIENNQLQLTLRSPP